MENMNWSDLAFGYMKTDYNVRCYYRDGKWGELEVSSSEIINIHMAATCLHYGQESFEGLKAFKGKDGKIRVFRMDENGKRMQASSRGIKMAELPVEMFEEAVRKVVKLNERFVPPYESGAALYIRPLMIGLGAQVGVKPAPEYMFMVFVTPVGPYFKGGFQPSKVCIMREFDRAAPYGTGTIKVGGNYAASLVAGEGMQPCCIWTRKKRNTWTNVVRLTSSVFVETAISLRNLIPSCLLLQTRVCSNWRKIWD